jgi:hypothetical protein
MAQLSPKEWEDHIVYLTREEPKVSINGSGGFLRKFVQPFDIDDIKRTFGGYKFSYIMKKEGKLIYGGDFRVEALPLYDRERENPPGSATPQLNTNNDLLKEFVSVLRDELQRSREANGNPSSDAAIDMVTKASERAMEIVKAQVPPGADATKQLESMVSMLKNLGVVGAQPQQSGGISDTILKVLIEKALMPVDPLAQLTTFITLFEKMDSLRGAPGKADWRSEAISAGRELLPQVLETISTARAPGTPRQVPPRYAPQRAPQPQPPARPMPSPGPSAAPAPGAAANGGGLRMVPMDEQPGPTAPEVAAQPGGDPFAFVNEDTYMAAVKQRIVQVVRAPQLTPEYAGDMLVDGLEMMWPDMLEQLKILTEEQITAFLSRDPILMYATQDPRWPAVLHCAKTAAMEAALDEAEDETPKPQRFKN